MAFQLCFIKNWYLCSMLCSVTQNYYQGIFMVHVRYLYDTSQTQVMMKMFIQFCLRWLLKLWNNFRAFNNESGDCTVGWGFSATGHPISWGPRLALSDCLRALQWVLTTGEGLLSPKVFSNVLAIWRRRSFPAGLHWPQITFHTGRQQWKAVNKYVIYFFSQQGKLKKIPYLSILISRCMIFMQYIRRNKYCLPDI